MRKLFCRVFGHWWKPTHYNRWFITTRRVCRVCTRAEIVKGIPAVFGEDEWILDDMSRAREAIQ